MHKSNKASKVILYATATGWINQAVSATSGLIILPIVVTHLGKTEYGIWVLVIQFVQFLSMSDLGVSNAMGRFVARARGSDDAKVMNQLYSTTMAFLALSGLIIALATVFMSPYIGWMLGIEKSYYNVTKNIFLITGLSIAIQMPFNLSVGILMGHQRYGPHGIGKILGSVANMLGVGFLYMINKIELEPLAIVSASSICISQLVTVVIARKITGPWSLNPKNISIKLMKEILSLSGSNLQITFGNYIYRSGLVIAVGRILGTQAAGIYGVVLTIISHIYTLISAFSNPIGTLASEFQAGGKSEDMKEICISVMRTIFSLSICCAVGLLIYGEPILRLLISKGNWSAIDYHHAGNMLFIMGIGFAFGLPQEVSARALKGMGKHWHVSNVSFFFSICAVIVGILIMYLSRSIYGAAIGWGSFWLLQGFLIYPQMLSKYLSVPFRRMIVESYLPGIIIGSIVFVIAWSFSMFLETGKIINLFIEITTCTLIGCFLIISSNNFKQLLFNRK
jgi:O-antigen/teichoic acid export membrane protein